MTPEARRTIVAIRRDLTKRGRREIDIDVANEYEFGLGYNQRERIAHRQAASTRSDKAAQDAVESSEDHE